MTLRELRYLVALAERVHFGKAAQACHVSQPTLSTQIRKLEEYLGVTLVERNSRSIALTPVGQEVADKARHIVDEVDALLARTRASAGPLAGPLSLGVIPTLAPYFLPWFIPRAKERYPRLQLVVQENLTGALVERLRAYRIDAALLALPVDSEEFEALPLFDEPFWFACAPRHPLAQAKSVSEAELRGEDLLLLADGHCLRGQALAACGRQAGAETDDFSAVSLETLCHLVAEGYGSTLLPALAAHAVQAGGAPLAIRPMRGAGASRRIGLVWRRGYPKAQELEQLAALVRDKPPQGTRTVLLEEKALRARRH